MLKTDQDFSLYPEWAAEWIQAEEVRAAFFCFVGVAAWLPDFLCHAKRKGAVRDFRFYDENRKQPFAFIVNRDSLLFYFRKPAIESGRYLAKDVRDKFDSFDEHLGKKELKWTVRLLSSQDVDDLIKFLGWY